MLCHVTRLGVGLGGFFKLGEKICGIEGRLASKGVSKVDGSLFGWWRGLVAEDGPEYGHLGGHGHEFSVKG
jgi:hypothetical protein